MNNTVAGQIGDRGARFALLGLWWWFRWWVRLGPAKLQPIKVHTLFGPQSPEVAFSTVARLSFDTFEAFVSVEIVSNS